MWPKSEKAGKAPSSLMVLVWHDAQLPLPGSLKQPQAAHLLRVQAGLLAQEGVVLAVVRIELGRRFLEHLERHQRGAEGGVFAIEDVVAEHLAERLRVPAAAQPGDHAGRRAVGHLVRGEQRDARLVVRGRSAAVPVVAAGRALVFGVVAVVLVEVLGERRHVLQIAQRRRGARAGLVHLRAAGLDGQVIGRPVGMGRAVAAGAGQPARGGQRGIEEQRLAQCRHGGHGRTACRHHRVEGLLVGRRRAGLRRSGGRRGGPRFGKLAASACAQPGKRERHDSQQADRGDRKQAAH